MGERLVADMTDFDAWLRYGIQHGFISDPTCYWHGFVPLTEKERDQFEQTGETSPCVQVARIIAPMPAVFDA